MSRHRTSPIRHSVKTHKREGNTIHTYLRGHGQHRDVYKTIRPVAIPRYMGLQKEEIAFKFSTKMIATLGASLYKRKVEAAIREPIQNAIDSGSPTVEVFVQQLPDRKVLVQIIDAGKGLTRADIEKYIATIGESSKAEDKGKVGKFGIGKLAPFMVADETYIVTSKGRPGDKLYVGVSQSGLTIEKGQGVDSGLSSQIHKRNVWEPPSHGTTVAFVLDSTRPEFALLSDAENGLGIDKDLSSKEQIKQAFSIIVGPTKKPIMLSDVDTGKVTLLSKHWLRKGAVKENLDMSGDTRSKVRVYSNGLYIQTIDAPFVRGEIDYNLRQAISLNREEIKKETYAQIKSWNSLTAYVNKYRDNHMGEIAPSLGSWQLGSALRHAGTSKAKAEVIRHYKLSILDGSVLRDGRLALFGYGDRALIVEESEFGDNRNQLEQFSQSSGIRVVIVPDDRFGKDVSRYLSKKGVKIIHKKVGEAKKKEKHREFKTITGKYKELSDEIKRLYGIEFGWASDSDPSTVAYALGGKIYMNKDSVFMKDLLESRTPVRDKALYMLGTTAHEWAHIKSGAQGHQDDWRQTMEALKYDLISRGISVSDPTTEGMLDRGRFLRIPSEIVNSDADGRADLAWVGNKLIAKVGRYDVTVSGILRHKGSVGHGHDNIKDGRINFPTPFLYDKKLKYFGKYQIRERPYDSDMVLLSGMKVKITNEGIWNGWQGVFTGKLEDALLPGPGELRKSPAHVIKLTKDAKGHKVSMEGHFFANEFTTV